MSGFFWSPRGWTWRIARFSGVSFLSNHQMTCTCDHCSSPSRPVSYFFSKTINVRSPAFVHVADGVDLELGERGLLRVFCGHDVAGKNSGGQEEGDGETDHGWLPLTDLVGSDRSVHCTANLRSSARVLVDMDTTLIKTKFEKLGARAKVRPLVRNRWQSAPSQIVIDVRHDRHGEFFDIQADDAADVEVLDVQPRDRHLLLMVRQPNQRPGLPDAKDKFLCGHDERHWFVAGIPEKAAVSSVVTAKEALKPDLVRNREQGKRGKRQKRLRRKTDVFIRQGEWFFVSGPECAGQREADPASRADSPWPWQAAHVRRVVSGRRNHGLRLRPVPQRPDGRGVPQAAEGKPEGRQMGLAHDGS